MPRKNKHGIKIYIIDDHTLVRAALESILSQTNDIEVIGGSSTGEAGVENVLKLKPDIVLLDYKLPDINGLQVLQQLKKQHSTSQIIGLSATDNDVVPFYFLTNGAASFLVKNTSPQELINAIRHTHEGQRTISPQIARQISLSRLDKKNSHNPFNHFSAKQLTVIKHIIQGRSNEEIAEQLNVEPKSIYNHRNRILKHLELNNDVELTLLAWKHHLLALE